MVFLLTAITSEWAPLGTGASEEETPDPQKMMLFERV